MSALMYSNYVIADVECRNITAQPTVGRYRLLFDVELVPKKWESVQVRGRVPYIVGLRMTVKVSGILLGMALPTEEDFLSPTYPDAPDSVPARRLFALDMDRQVLEGIEVARKERDAAFELEVIGTASVLHLEEAALEGMSFGSLTKETALPFEPRLTKANVYHRVPRSDWIELLDRMGYGRTLLFEIPWPEGEEDGLSKAVARFEAARAAFLSGSYTEAVAKLRDSMDRAAEAVEVGKLVWKKAGSRESRERMGLNERFSLVWNTVRHLTHPAHHDGSYSREEARYALGMGALALSLAAKRPGVLKDAEGQDAEEVRS